jgi:hypothetical protein
MPASLVILIEGECDIETMGARINYFALTKIFSGGLNLIARAPLGHSWPDIETGRTMTIGGEEAR